MVFSIWSLLLTFLASRRDREDCEDIQQKKDLWETKVNSLSHRFALVFVSASSYKLNLVGDLLHLTFCCNSISNSLAK